MIATPTTITTPATTVRASMGSRSRIAPRTNATTGLTYAYVAICGSGAMRSSQTYVV